MEPDTRWLRVFSFYRFTSSLGASTIDAWRAGLVDPLDQALLTFHEAREAPNDLWGQLRGLVDVRSAGSTCLCTFLVLVVCLREPDRARLRVGVLTI